MNYPKRFRKVVFGLACILIIFCFSFIIIGFICLFGNYDLVDKQQAITEIIIPMVCGLIGACIPIAINNSLSNEKLKISLNRLEWRWKYHYTSHGNAPQNGDQSLGFDKEYKFIVENRGKSHKKILKLMKDDYWSDKYSFYEKQVGNNGNIKKMTREEFLENWIEDHFIY